MCHIISLKQRIAKILIVNHHNYREGFGRKHNNLETMNVKLVVNLKALENFKPLSYSFKNHR